MVKADVIEGVVVSARGCHYDIANDVLYLRLLDERETPTFAEKPRGRVYR